MIPGIGLDAAYNRRVFLAGATAAFAGRWGVVECEMNGITLGHYDGAEFPLLGAPSAKAWKKQK